MIFLDKSCTQSLASLGFLTLVLCLLSACHPDDAPVPALRSVPGVTMDGGGSGNTGDDDDPVIQGNVVNDQQLAVSNAQVVLLDSLGTSPIDTTLTDSAGYFVLPADTGSYRLGVSASGYLPALTDTILVEASVSTSVELQE